MKRELMIDLETMSTKPNAAITSIGVALMDTDNFTIVDVQQWNIQLQSSQEAGLHIDARTIEWWLGQSAEARAGLYDPEPMPLRDALMEITSKYYAEDSYPTWGNGAAFDNVIYRNACEAVNVMCPFVFHHDRCYRTMKNMYPIILQGPRSVSELHRAAYDAEYQAEHLLRILRHIRGRNESVRQDGV